MVDETCMIRVRYWASAKQAAGVAEDVLSVDGAVTLTEVRRRAVALHPDGGLEKVLTVCSTLVEDRPCGAAAPDDIVIQPGSRVEFLPPFAGG